MVSTESPNEPAGNVWTLMTVHRVVALRSAGAASSVPVLMISMTWTFFTGLNDQSDLRPFMSALGFFIISFVGIGISFYPMMVPPTLTIWEAAAPESSLAFALVGAVILLPIILAYTAYAYWVFRGKMDPNEGYH